jgi:rhodanese-related sulfurtransferase
VRAILAGAAKEALILLLVGAIVGLAVNAVRKNGVTLLAEPDAFRIRTNAEFISTEDAWDLYEQGTAFFIDPRNPEAFAAERIEGALNASPTQSGVDSLAWIVAADPYVITYASVGSQRQAGVLADKLLEAGFKKVKVLLDGLDGWKRAGHPVEGQTPRGEAR